MTDRETFENFLRSLASERQQDVIASLEVYEEQFTQEHAIPGTATLLNISTELPERQRGMFEIDARMVVGRVVYRLLRCLKDHATAEAAVRQILPQLTSLGAKLELITIVGYRKGEGQRLVSESAAGEFEEGWRVEVRSATVASLANEVELVWIFLRAKRDAAPGEPPFQLPDAPSITRALLRSARSESRRQMPGTRAIQRAARLAWNELVELFGDEGNLREQIERLKATQPDGVDELLQLADQYLGGWRPSDFGED